MTLLPDQIKIGQRIKVLDYGTISSVDGMPEDNTIEVTWDHGCSADLHPEAVIPIFNETFDEVLDRLRASGEATEKKLDAINDKILPGYEEFQKLAARLGCAEDPFAAWETLELILTQHEELHQIAVATKHAHDNMFAQCASNPITNAWGGEVNVATLNEAGDLANTYFSKHGQ